MNDIAKLGALAPESLADTPEPDARGDMSAFWMPFTANRHYKAAPRLVAKAEGMYYWTPDGRQVLDGTAGLWCVNAGHCRKPIVEAIQRQAATMDYAPAFQMGQIPRWLWADQLEAKPWLM